MKEKARKYSVIIVSSATFNNQELSISSNLVRNTIIGFLALLLFSGFIFFDYLNTSLNKEKLKRLDKENIEKPPPLIN